MKRLLMVLAGAAAAMAQDTILIRNAHIHPVAGQEIPGGSVLIQKGKIAGVGVKLAAPKGATVIDAKGMHLYPGMIDSATAIGLTEIGAVRETNDTNELGEYNPQLRALIAVNPESEHIDVTRANGITSVMTLPAGGVISGQGALIHLDGWTWEEMSVAPSVAIRLNFPVLAVSSAGPGSRSSQGYEDAKKRYEEQLDRLRLFLEDARRYDKAKRASAATVSPDPKFEAMLPVLSGKTPLLVVAVRERAILDAIQFARREKLKIILAGVREPGKALAEMAKDKIPVILPETHALPLEEDDAYDSQYTLPAELHQAGIKFAFGSFDTQFARNLPYQAAAAVAFGLPKDVALKAVTSNAAEIWGLGSQLGTIEEGKLADLILTDGDPLETRTQIRQMFIGGRPVSLESRHTRLYEKYSKRPQ
ncbi:MAG: amidohydrolase family protein [Bryobacterales bacterium]|nr:amidohydrolase family protein [Bryobacterales bacterium]